MTGSIDDRITVFLLDDHELVRRGLHELISLEDDLEVVGEAATAAEALARNSRGPPRRCRARCAAA